jgi:hypothetical protein
MKRITPLILTAAFLLGGCYHATVVTGLQPSAEVIEKNFASAWIYGLVPPATVETMEQCENGVAKVETQLSFVNQLVGALTAGIYTPMSITVTCAAGDTSDAQIRLQEGQDVVTVFSEAADLAVESGESVLVAFE